MMKHPEVAVLIEKIQQRQIEKLTKKFHKHLPELAKETVSPDNLLKLAKKFPLRTDFFLPGRITTIFSVRDGTDINALVVVKNKFFYFKMSPREFIDNWIQRKCMLSSYQDMAYIFGRALGNTNLRHLPLCHEHLLLIPLGPVKDDLTIWVDPSHLDDFYQMNGVPVIELSFGVKIKSPATEARSIIGYMTNAYSIQTVIALYHSVEEPAHREPIKHFLGVRDSKLTRKALDGLTIDKIDPFEDDNAITKAARAYFYEVMSTNDVLAKDANQIIKKGLLEKDLNKLKNSAPRIQEINKTTKQEREENNDDNN